MKPGIYEGLSFEEYQAIEALNQSALKSMKPTPRHFYEEHLAPNREKKPATKAQLLGSAIHTAILEPDQFDVRYAKLPECDRRTKAGKELYDKFVVESGTKQVLSSDEFDLCSMYLREARKSLTLSTIMESGEPEVTIVWEDKETGILLKARIDWLAPEKHLIFDPKTTVSAEYFAFQRSVVNYGYDIQAAFYCDGLKVLTDIEYAFVFGAFEKNTFLSPAYYFASEEILDRGRKEYRRLLSQYKFCRDNNVWPGYPDEIQSLTLPKWASNNTTEATQAEASDALPY